MHLRPSKVDCYSLSSSMGWVGFNFILMNINKLCHESYTGKKLKFPGTWIIQGICPEHFHLEFPGLD